LKIFKNFEGKKMIKQRKLYLPKALEIWEKRGSKRRKIGEFSVRKIDTPAEEQQGSNRDVNHPRRCQKHPKIYIFYS